MIRVTWALSPNVGDALTPWLVRHLSGIEPVYTPADRPGEKYILGGSILNWADADTYAWGAGVAWQGEKVNPAAKITSVRGPLSRAAALACGARCPPIYGDPALVVPMLYRPPVQRGAKVGVVPHYVDQERAHALYGDRSDVRIIDPLAPVEEFAEAICSCPRVVSSSLHGLAFALAYGVPCAWATLSHGVIGDGTKYRDLLWALGIEADQPWDLREVGVEGAPDAAALAARATLRTDRAAPLAARMLEEYPLPRRSP